MYKRQAFAILLTLLATSALARPNFRQRIEDLRNQKQNSQQIAQQEEININGTSRTYIVDNVNYNKSNPKPLMIVSVSYTHLDVYKRQFLSKYFLKIKHLIYLKIKLEPIFFMIGFLQFRKLQN